MEAESKISKVPKYFTKEYEEGLNNDLLLEAVCQDCGERVIPPRGICPNCRSINMEFKEVSTYVGTIITYTTIHVAPPTFAGETPYTTGIVELETGERLLVRIKSENPDVIFIGAKGELDFDPSKRGSQRLFFRPLGG